MKFLVQNYHVLMAKSLAFRSVRMACFASSCLKWDGRVSLVQGASRGIGLEFVKQLLEKNDKGQIIASRQNPDRATGLIDLRNKFSERLSILPLDLTIESTVEHMLPLLKAGGGSGTERDVAVMANLSARVGSIGDNRLGG